MILHYEKIGHGSEILLAFHGMGQDFSCFQKFAQTFDNQYTTYLFDLPFHGKSTPDFAQKEEVIFTKSDLKNFLKSFLGQHQIERFSVIGFSMGGRFALATLEAFTDQINNAFLIAPDGISENFFYIAATRFKFTRPIFKLFAYQKERFQTLGNILVRLKLLPESTIRFAQRMLDTSTKQDQIYYAWIGFHQLTFNIPKLSQHINSQNVKVTIFMGKYDKLLPLKAISSLSKKLKNCDVIILPTGHTNLVEKVREYFVNLTTQQL
jgi:pimeloyl-ACP methyl ester carboxylesterase